MLVFLATIDSGKEGLSFIPNLINKENEIYYFLVSSMQSKLKTKDRLEKIECDNNYSIEYQVFTQNQFVGLKHQNNNESYYIWMNGSKLHKTHNKDNDLGSFYLSDHLGEVFVKNKGIDIRNHNVVTINELLQKGNPISVTEADINEYRLPRGINGQVELVLNNEEAYVFKHNAMSYFEFSEVNLVQNHTRYFVFLKRRGFNFVIVDKIISTYKTKCEARFHVHSSIKLDSNVVDNSLVCGSLRVSSLGGSLEVTGNVILNITNTHEEVSRIVTFIKSSKSSVQPRYIESLLYSLSI